MVRSRHRPPLQAGGFPVGSRVTPQTVEAGSAFPDAVSKMCFPKRWGLRRGRSRELGWCVNGSYENHLIKVHRALRAFGVGAA